MDKNQKNNMLIIGIIFLSVIVLSFPAKILFHKMVYPMWLYEDCSLLTQRFSFELQDYYDSNGKYPDSLDELSEIDYDFEFNTSYNEAFSCITYNSDGDKCQLTIDIPSEKSKWLTTIDKGEYSWGVQRK